MKLTNFKLYTPESIDTPELNIAFLISDEGKDWYESQSLFSEKTLKIAFDEKGIIRSCSEDVSQLWPVGLSVTEVDTDVMPDGFDINGDWVFDGAQVVRRSFTNDEMIVQAENQKQKLLQQAREKTQFWQIQLTLGIISDSDKQQLINWMRYVQQVEAT
uniref:tail fiber assembly protein n=2 Tax=Enterobacteriaceae TaxID=543 RepID=UPI000A1003F8